MTQPEEQRVDDAIGDPTRQYAQAHGCGQRRRLDARRRSAASWNPGRRTPSCCRPPQDENMAGGERPQLQDVMLALHELERIQRHDQH